MRRRNVYVDHFNFLTKASKFPISPWNANENEKGGFYFPSEGNSPQQKSGKNELSNWTFCGWKLKRPRRSYQKTVYHTFPLQNNLIFISIFILDSLMTISFIMVNYCTLKLNVSFNIIINKTLFAMSNIFYTSKHILKVNKMG